MGARVAALLLGATAAKVLPTTELPEAPAVGDFSCLSPSHFKTMALSQAVAVAVAVAVVPLLAMHRPKIHGVTVRWAAAAAAAAIQVLLLHLLVALVALRPQYLDNPAQAAVAGARAAAGQGVSVWSR
jgi:hypothetical protein